MSILLLVVFTTLAVSAICSLMEATLYSTRIASLETAKSHNRHVASATAMLLMKKDIVRPTSAILILNTIANTAGATVAGMLAAREFGEMGVPVFSALLTIAILLLAEILPKTIGAVHWRVMWPFVVPPLKAIEKILAPIIWLTQWFSEVFVKGKAAPVTTEAEILSLIRMGAGVGELSPTELELLTNVFQFDEVITRQVMIPRRQVVGFDVKWDLQQCLAVIAKAGHTRYPLYDESLDSVVGLIHVKDLVGIPNDQEFDLRKISREMITIPENTPLRSLLTQMQTMHRHMSAVYDEHSTFVGIITLENVIEQIVGAVQDEFDNELPDFAPQEDGSFHIRGATPVFAVNKRLQLKLNYPKDIDTISGLVVHKLGRVPVVGDELTFEGANVIVLEMIEQRISLLAIKITDAPDSEED